MNQTLDLQVAHRPLKVLIVGAGTGGLCLAQGLKATGIAVQVFERDLARFDRQAGTGSALIQPVTAPCESSARRRILARSVV